MTERVQADVVVIGGGPSGVAAAAAARAASGGSARVVLVDDGAHGPRPVTGRPVAALLREASAAGLDWAAARTTARSALAHAGTAHAGTTHAGTANAGTTDNGTTNADTAAAAALDGVRVVLGRASFAGRGTVEVDPPGADSAGGPLRIATKRVVLATGSAPALPEVTGLVDTRYVTPDTLLDVTGLPQTVAVVGAGRRGVALAQALARFGVTVTLVDAEPRVLPALDEDVSATIEAALRTDGVRLLLGSPVVKVAPTLDDGAWVGTEAGSDVAAELLVVATGRRADLAGLDLPSAGVVVGRGGAVTIDARLRTTEPSVLATGRAAGHRPDLGMARLAGANAVARLRAVRWTPAPLVLSVPTDPAVAVVGIGERDARRTPGARVHEIDGTAELVRIVVSGDRDPRVLRVTVVSRGAADAAAVAALVIAADLPAQRLADLAEPDTALATLAAALARPGRPA